MNYKPTLANAIKSLVPESVTTVIDNKEIIWIEPKTPPVTNEQIQTEYNRLLELWDNLEYQRIRAKEYPSIKEQMDMQYWDSVNNTTTWQDAIDAVKAKYPKPEGV